MKQEFASPSPDGVLDLINFVEVEGVNFPYRLFVPPDYDRHEARLWPLAVFLQGGFGTYELVANHPEIFAAAFPLVMTPLSNDERISTEYLNGASIMPREKKAKALAKVHLKIFIGSRDKWTPAEAVEKDVQSIREAGGEVELHVQVGGHGGYRLNWVYDMIFDWFDAHAKVAEETVKEAPAQHEN